MNEETVTISLQRYEEMKSEISDLTSKLKIVNNELKNYAPKLARKKYLLDKISLFIFLVCLISFIIYMINNG